MGRGGKQVREVEVPSNKENLAFLAIFVSYEVEIKDSIATFIRRERAGEIIIAFFRAAKFLYHHFLTINLEDNESVVSFCF